MSELSKETPLSKDVSLSKETPRSGNVALAMFVTSLYLKDVPMNYRDKVVMCLLILTYFDTCIKTAYDLVWVNNQLKQMERDFKNDDDDDVALCWPDSPEWDRTSDE